MAIALVLGILLTDPGTCYFVGNTRIIAMPTCDVAPATIEMLTEDPAPVRGARGPAPRRLPRGGPTIQAGCTVGIRGNEELERRLELANQERIAIASQKVAAEQARDAALRQRDRALSELERVRKELSAARGRPASGGEPREDRSR